MSYDEEEVYETFWKEIITNKDGTMNIDKLKAELLDFYNMINEVSIVYSAVTGCMFSKPTWSADTVLLFFDERFGSKAAAVDCLKYDWDEITRECVTRDDIKNAIFEYFNID